MDWIATNNLRTVLATVATGNISEAVHSDISKLQQLFMPPFRKVGDSILISTKNVAVLSEAYEKAVCMYGDRTGYEASNTETCINDFFDNDLSCEAGIRIALSVIELWALQLKQLDPASQFCIILCCNGNRVEIRFHKVRENELPWLADSIDSYQDSAIGFTYV